MVSDGADREHPQQPADCLPLAEALAQRQALRG